MRYGIIILFALIMQACQVRTPEPVAPKGLFPTVDPNWSSSLDSLFLYSYGICIVMIAACVAIIIWAPLPSLKKWAYIGLTFAGTLMGLGITFSIIKPFLPLMVLSCVAIGVGIGVWYIIANFDALRQFIHKDPINDNLSSGAKKLVVACQNLPKPTTLK